MIVDDYLALDTELYQSIKNAMTQPSSKLFHLKPKHPESWNPAYNFVMLLKWWCVCDAIKRGSTSESVAWMISDSIIVARYILIQDFEFTWTCEVDDKINLFCINQPDETRFLKLFKKWRLTFRDAHCRSCEPVDGI